jgi:hypothetical protein
MPALPPDLHEEPGWTGVFTRNEAPGCYPNTTRVVKVQMEAGDANPLGTTGTVLGSLSHPAMGTAYFVEWDTMPRVAVAVMAWKLARQEDHDGAS